MRVIAEALPATRQTLLFSATMTASLVAMQKDVLQDAFHFQVRGTLPKGRICRAKQHMPCNTFQCRDLPQLAL